MQYKSRASEGIFFAGDGQVHGACTARAVKS